MKTKKWKSYMEKMRIKRRSR